MSKKIIAILCGLMLVVAASACSSKKESGTTAKTPAVMESYSSEYDALANYFYNKDYRQCIEMATDLINGSGENVALLTYRGVAYAKLNKPYDAFRDLIAATKIDYKSATLVNAGNALRMFGYCARAADAYRQALSLEPTNMQIMMNLTSAYLCYGADDLASETFVKMISDFPNDAVAFTNAAVLKYNMHDYQEAKSGAQKALEFDAFYKPAYHMLMVACRELNDTACAQEAEKQLNSLKGQTFRNKTFAR